MVVCCYRCTSDDFDFPCLEVAVGSIYEVSEQETIGSVVDREKTSQEMVLMEQMGSHSSQEAGYTEQE